jgi:hypothetical protein
MRRWSEERTHLRKSNPVWAGFLKDWDGPVEGERPAAYILILGDTEIRKSFGCDPVIAAQSIMLGAIDREALRTLFDIPERYDVLLGLALGKPKETVVLEEARPEGDVRYYRDEQGVHHVPKRPLEELILQAWGE